MNYVGEIVFLIVSLIFICLFKDIRGPMENFIAGGMPIFGNTEKRADCSLNPPNTVLEEEPVTVMEETPRNTDNIIETMVDSATKCFSCEAQLGYKGNNTKCFSCEAQMGEAGQQKKCFSCGSTLLDNTDAAFTASCPNCDKNDNKNLSNVSNYFLLD